MEVARRRGRRRKKLLDDLKDRRGYSHLKEEALDRTVWRHRFGGGFGHVVRQITDWMNELRHRHKNFKFGKLMIVKHFIPAENLGINNKLWQKKSICQSLWVYVAIILPVTEAVDFSVPRFNVSCWIIKSFSRVAIFTGNHPEISQKVFLFS